MISKEHVLTPRFPSHFTDASEAHVLVDSYSFWNYNRQTVPKKQIAYKTIKEAGSKVL